MDHEQLAAVTEKVVKWAEKISQNQNVPAKEFLREGLALKEETLQSIEKMSPRCKAGGEFQDPLFAGVEKAINADAKQVRDKIVELVYAGDLDPIDYYEALRGVLADKSAMSRILPALRKDTAQQLLGSCELCVTCVSCVSCSACVVCFATGVEATAVAIYASTTSTSAASAS